MDEIRNGNFTSSEIVALLDMGERQMNEAELEARPKKGTGSRTTTCPDKNSFGDAAMTYIIECNMERRLGRSLCDEITANATSWGKLLEKYLHELLGISYEYFSDKTMQHPSIKDWVGTADFRNNFPELAKAICDSKCPWTHKSFCQLVDPWYEGFRDMDYWRAVMYGWTDKKGHFRKPHPQAKKYFYQLVSNACIYDTKFAELIVYMPYKSELDGIRSLASNLGAESGMFRFWSKPDEELPHLIDGGYYKNLNVFRFEVPFLEKSFLTERVILASKELIEI